MHRCLVLLWPLLLATAAASAQSPKNRIGRELFEKKIRPALIRYCYECHAEDSEDVGGGLLLDSRMGWARGGESGPAILPGKPRDSLFMRAIEYRDLEMPPDEQLPDALIDDFRRWIAMGAVDPRDGQASLPAQPDPPSVDLWSLKPVEASAPPQSGDSCWPRVEADQFILQRLDQEGLRPNADAAPAVLIRRLYFDLIGLPPSPDEVAAFVADPSEHHYLAIVDRLLASAHFGERWGRHWLDVARYGESAGSSRDVLMPYAWKYRDFVIDAYNADLPFDRFVTEQIAGDLLPAESPQDKYRQVVATGLLAIGSKSLNGGNLTYDVIDDQIDVISKAVLGLTVSCARCHDHKFDPIPTADYYSLAGIFLSTETRYGGGTKRPKNAKEKSALYLTLGGELDPQAAEAQPEPEYAVGVREAKKITDANILIRGEKSQTGPLAKRGFLSCIAGPSASTPVDPIDPSESGRRQLAAWLVHPDNPLTPRVAVNRIWQHLMGSGLVETVDNFGVTGTPPSNLPLLDFLAHRFIHVHDWSTKAMIRELVASRTYRMSSQFNPLAFERDPENRLRWRMNRRRLEAEALRDAMLAVGGRLNPNPLDGSLVMQIGEGEVGRNLDTSVLDEPFDHRSVYLPIIRGMIPEPLKLFDFPEASNVQGLRDSNTTPTQSLYLMNSKFAVSAAESFATSLLRDRSLGTDPARIQAAHLRCFAVPPSDQRVQRDLRFIEDMMAGHSGADEDGRRQLAWTTYCQSLLASAKFRFVD